MEAKIYLSTGPKTTYIIRLEGQTAIGGKRVEYHEAEELEITPQVLMEVRRKRCNSTISRKIRAILNQR
jgi:hypothetical protein